MIGPNPFPKPFGSPLSNPRPGAPLVTKNAPPTVPREQSMPRFVNYLADYSGCGHWRILWPEQGVKCVKLQRQASKSQVDFVKHLKKVQQEHGFKIIYEVDDVVFREEIPDYNKFKFAFDTAEVRDNCIQIMDMADEITVTCDFMRKLFQSKLTNKKVTVIPNFGWDIFLIVVKFNKHLRSIKGSHVFFIQDPVRITT